jgi:hypothetical protein
MCRTEHKVAGFALVELLCSKLTDWCLVIWIASLLLQTAMHT